MALLGTRPRGLLSGSLGLLGAGPYLGSGRGLLGSRRRCDECYDCQMTLDGLHVCGPCLDRLDRVAAAQLQLDQYACNCSYCEYYDAYAFGEYLPARSALQCNSLAGLLIPGGYSGSVLHDRRRGLGLLGGSLGGGLTGALGGYGGLGTRRVPLTRGRSYCEQRY